MHQELTEREREREIDRERERDGSFSFVLEHGMLVLVEVPSFQHHCAQDSGAEGT